LVYVVTILIVVVAGAGGLGIWVVHEENKPGDRPAMTIMRRGRRVVRKVMAGDPCPCGAGTLEETGIVSPRLGAILGCPICQRRWAMDGRRVSTRRLARRPGLAETADDSLSLEDDTESA
jgi:hypothetical protein